MSGVVTASDRFVRVDYFGGRSHGYKLDGRKIQSVTGALKGIPAPALVGWAAREAAQFAVENHEDLFHASDASHGAALRAIADAPNRTRNRAAFKGTQVHRAAERLVHGEEVAGIPDEYAGKVDAYVSFLNRWRVRPLLVEGVVCNTSVPYGGTLDLVFTSDLFPGRVFLADVKTSRQVYGENALQLAAYGAAEFYVGPDGVEVPMSDLGVTDHVVIHLRDESFEVVSAYRGPEAFDLFLHAATIARAMDGKPGETDLDLMVSGPLYLPGEAWL